MATKDKKKTGKAGKLGKSVKKNKNDEGNAWFCWSWWCDELTVGQRAMWCVFAEGVTIRDLAGNMISPDGESLFIIVNVKRMRDKKKITDKPCLK